MNDSEKKLEEGEGGNKRTGISIEELIRNAEKVFDERVELASKFKSEFRDRSASQKEFEVSKWQELKKIVEGERYFKLAHINKLDLPYDIFICLSAKNSGKTWEQYRMFKEFVDRGEKFIFMRVLRTELGQSATDFFQDKQCPIVMVEHKYRYHVYDKRAYEHLCEIEEIKGKLTPRLEWRLFDKYSIPIVGYAVDFCNANSIGGGTFEGFKYVVFDECLTHNSKNLVTKVHLENFSKFLSSVIRSKKEFKVYMFGNLTPKNNLILEYYGISPSDNFRYIENSGCKILYVNLSNSYGASYENQSAVTRGTADINSILELRDNLPRPCHEKILNIDPSLNSEFELVRVIAYICSYNSNKRKLFLEVYGFKVNSSELESKRNYLIRIKELELEDVINYKVGILTDDIPLSTLGKGRISYRPKVWKQISRIFDLYSNNCLYYADTSSYEDFVYVFSKYTKRR